jgi:Putative zinc-finger
VKCSLLTLSTFIDEELPPPRRAEVDAHLVGCPRCTAGVATLREEKARVGQLARVRVDPGSAQSMLEQVGIAVDAVALPATSTPPPPSADELPWQSGRSSPSLPWTPRRPVVTPATSEMSAPDTDPDVQPELPLEGVRSSPAFWDRAASADVEDPVALTTDAALGAEPGPAGSSTVQASSNDADQPWLGAPAPSHSWETDLPPPLDESASDDATWSLDETPIRPSEPPPAPPMPPAVPVPTPVPTRLAAAAGPAALFSRIRDAVTVRMALSRGGDAVEDSMQIVSGAPLQRGTQLTEAAAPAPPEVVVQPVSEPAAASATAPAEQEVELEGLARPTKLPVSASVAGARERTARADRPALADRTTPGRWGDHVDDGDREPPPDADRWNAFAASSYPIEAETIGTPPATPARPLGRHSRAVARERVALSTRILRAAAAMTAALRMQGRSAVTVVRQRLSGISRGGPDSRLLAIVAVIGLVFVIALLIGHSTKPAAPAAARSAPAAVATHPKASAPAQSSGAAATTAPSVIPAQTFGSGATGFQVIRLRYGVQPSAALRVVFDLGGGTAGGSPRVVVSFTNPTTMLVTLYGTLPAGSTGVPPPGKAIASVTLVSSGSQTTVYRFALTHAVTPRAFYLQSPTRFVLDLH